MRRTTTLLALALLLSAGFIPAVEAQGDSSSGHITFGKEHRGQEPDYWEGGPVRIYLNGSFASSPDRLEVRCLDCPESDHVFVANVPSRAYPGYEDSDGDTHRDPVVFPRDFDDGARDAAEHHQPRWNGTWQVRVLHDSAVQFELDRANFDVYLTDQFQRDRSTIEPGDIFDVGASGYPSGATVHVRLYQDHPDGSRSLTWSANQSVIGDSGRTFVPWRVPLDLAKDLYCDHPPHDPCRRFTLEVTGVPSDKPKETLRLPFRPAQIESHVDAYPEAPQRTETLRAEVELQYHDRLHAGPLRFAPQDEILNATVAFHVERVHFNGTVERVATVEAPYDVGARAWTPEWVIPKDLPLNDGTQPYRYRYALAEQTDKHGNVIPYTPLDTFQIHPYELKPEVDHKPVTLERLEKGRFVFNFTYADGTYLEPGDNASRLRGTLQRVADAQGNNVSSPSIEVYPTYEGDGQWVWSHRFGKEYQQLGTWRFRFDGTPLGTQAEDEHGNKLVANSTRTFPLTVAHPRIEVDTIVAGETRNATRGFDRGDTVTVNVQATYPDGSPYNADDLPPKYREGLPVKVHRINQDGIETNLTRINLELVSSFRGAWRGSFHIPQVRSGAPIGTWDIEVHVEDNVTRPNVNTTHVERPVGAETLSVSTVIPPRRDIVAGRPNSWSFRVTHGDGTQVTPNDAGTDLTVDVVRWENGHPGPVLREGIQPYYEAGLGRGAWTVDWTPPKTMEAGTYAFHANGTDLHGNVLEQAAWSRPFRVSLDTEPRDVLLQPPLTVKRGTSVRTVFHGLPGDHGFDDAIHPRIVLERYQERYDRWITYEKNAYVANESSGREHHALWETTSSTPQDTYRFRITGRAGDGSVLVGTTQTFNVHPRNLTRLVVDKPVPFAEKGSTITAVVERRTGDHVRGFEVQGPRGLREDVHVQKQRHGDNWTLTWEVPYDLPDGPYTLKMLAEDRYGNTLHARIGPITVGKVNLTVHPMIQPPSLVKRGDTGEFVFRVLYPDRTLMEDDHGEPKAFLLKDGHPVEELNLTFDGVNWRAHWTPAPDAEPTSYRFRVEGHDRAGNTIPQVQSQTFDVAPGTVTREVLEGQPQVKRLQTMDLLFDARPDDEHVTFRLYHYGAHPPGSPRLGPGFEPRLMGTLPHEWVPDRGVYRVTWEVPKDAPTGHYRVEMEGKDTFGNTIKGHNHATRVESVKLNTRWVDQIDGFPLGEQVSYDARIRYPDGSFMKPEDGEPLFIMTLDGQPLRPRPEARYNPEERTWSAVWTFPLELPRGNYALRLTGGDDYGNTLIPRTSNSVRYEPGTVQQITGATSIPGPGAVLALLSAAGIAWAMGRPPRLRR